MQLSMQHPDTGDTRPAAVFSSDRVYRYTLLRKFSTGEGICLFIMLNPSTADETLDDPTIRRCMGFAKRWGYRELQVVNIFAYRATDPRDLKDTLDPVGPWNDKWITESVRRASVTVAAWGNHGRLYGRSIQVKQLLEGHTVYRLGVNKTGEPVHPLYQLDEQELELLWA